MIGFILCLFVDWPMIGWGGGGSYKRQFALLLNCLPPGRLREEWESSFPRLLY